jgi:tRNA(Ile)-lysidine synthase
MQEYPTSEEFLKRVEQMIVEENLLDRNEPTVVGVSGGPDSLTLMDVLNRLGYPLIIAHLNHQIRPEAWDEEEEVKRFAEDRGLRFVSSQVNVPEYARDQGFSLEEAARTARYQFLFAEARKSEAQAVAVGHTADDQVETVLMHFLRGAGLPGLKGMRSQALPNSWSEEIALVRPLLAIWRQEVLAYCRERDLEPVLDASNEEFTFYRNRLRHELIPILEQYNPEVRSVIWRTAQVLAGDEEVLERISQTAWERCLSVKEEDAIILHLTKLRQEVSGVKRRVIRRAIETLRPDFRDLDFESVDRASNFIDKPTRSFEMDLTAGLRLIMEEDRLIIAGWSADIPEGNWPQMDKDVDVLEISGEILLANGWIIQAEEVTDIEEAWEQAQVNEDPNQVWIDGEAVERSIFVRTRREGDRFQPLGMGGHTTRLSDYLINVKMPKRARAKWPLVSAGDEIAWVPGYALAHPFRLSESTKRAIHLHLKSRSHFAGNAKRL